MLECLTELSEGTIGTILRTCGRGGRVEIRSLLLPEMRCITCGRRLRLRGVGGVLDLRLRVEMGGVFVLIVQRGSRVIVQTLLRNVGSLGLVVICEGWLGDRLGLRSE